MGRTRVKTKNLRPPQASTSAPAPPSLDALLDKARQLIIQCEYPLASRFAKRIVDREPAHLEGREILGYALLESGELEQAAEVRPSFPYLSMAF
jgi:hypothetical protein